MKNSFCCSTVLKYVYFEEHRLGHQILQCVVICAEKNYSIYCIDFCHVYVNNNAFSSFKSQNCVQNTLENFVLNKNDITFCRQ